MYNLFKRFEMFASLWKHCLTALAVHRLQMTPCIRSTWACGCTCWVASLTGSNRLFSPPSLMRRLAKVGRLCLGRGLLGMNWCNKCGKGWMTGLAVSKKVLLESFPPERCAPLHQKCRRGNQKRGPRSVSNLLKDVQSLHKFSYTLQVFSSASKHFITFWTVFRAECDRSASLMPDNIISWCLYCHTASRTCWSLSWKWSTTRLRTMQALGRCFPQERLMIPLRDTSRFCSSLWNGWPRPDWKSRRLWKSRNLQQRLKNFRLLWFACFRRNQVQNHVFANVSKYLKCFAKIVKHF